MIETEKKISALNYEDLRAIIDTFGEEAGRKDWRLKSANAFLELGMPGKPDEAWRRLRMTPVLMNKALGTSQIEFDMPSGLEVYSLHGIQEELPLFEEYIKEYTNRSAQRSARNKKRANDVTANKLLSLNKALSREGLFIKAEKGWKGDKPIHIKIQSQGENSLYLPQIHFWVEEEASLQVFIEYSNPQGSNDLINGFVTGIVDKRASLEILTSQMVDTTGHIYLFDSYFVEEEAHLGSHIFTMGGKQSFIDGHYTLQGKKGTFKMYGISTAKGSQVVGEKLSVEHHAPETISDTSFRCVLYDKATSVFTGNIKIPQGSYGSEGYEENKNLILGDDCFAQSIPQLEIIENDVKCSHGAAISSTEPEDLYFLMARGISREKAEELLIRAFYRDILEKMSLINQDKWIKERIYKAVQEKTGLNLDKNVFNWEE